MGGTSDTGRTAPRSDVDSPRGAAPAEHDELNDQESIYRALMEDPVFVKLNAELKASIQVAIDCSDDLAREVENYQCGFESKLEAFLTEVNNAFRDANREVIARFQDLQDPVVLRRIRQNPPGWIPDDRLNQDKVREHERKNRKIAREFYELPQSFWDARDRYIEALTEFEKKDDEFNEWAYRKTHSPHH